MALVLGFLTREAETQIRKVPKASKGGREHVEIWEPVPIPIRNYPFPEFSIPRTLEEWKNDRRDGIRQRVIQCLGDIPPRPRELTSRITRREDRGEYVLERFEFDNEVDGIVPGYLMIPKNGKRPAPTIIALHGHVSSKEGVTIEKKSSQRVGEILVQRGYVVAAIDSYFCGERVGTGPATGLDDRKGEEHSYFKLHLWFGRTLWGMMLRDEQILLDYLGTRPEVDANRIGATGMSMGCTRSWWLAAIDERVKAIAGIACFTRYTELIAHGNLRMHGIYYFVPGILKHFDVEAVYSLVAPRPMLMLSGDEDGGAPTSGIITLENILGKMYGLYDVPENFRSVLYSKTGHEYLPEMKEEMVTWFETHLPVQ
jgi:dienelactone hydrolase